MRFGVRFCLVALTLTSRIFAQPSSRFTVTLDDCDTPPIAETELRKALATELEAAELEDLDREDVHATLRYPECSVNASELELSIEFRLGAKTDSSMFTRIRLSDVPPASRVKTVAIAVVESLRVTKLAAASEPPATAPLEPVSPSTERPSRPPTRAGTPETPPRRVGVLRVAMSAQVSKLTSNQDAYGGFEGTLGYDLGAHWHPRLHLAYLKNTSSATLGTVDFSAIVASCGWDRILLHDPFLSVGPEFSRTTARAAGHSYFGISETPKTRAFWSAGARTTLEVPLSTYLHLSTSVHLATILQGAAFKAGQESVARFRGLQYGGTLGLSLRP